MRKLANVCVLTNIEEDFDVVSELGSGSFATVTKQRSKDSGISYAIKSI
jgi:hypothetical protein